MDQSSGTSHEKTNPVRHLKQLGTLLLQRRTELNLSLKEVENATSIRMNYLQALEEGAAERLISPIYAQGFFKQYANFLGLEGEELLREYGSLFHHHDSQEFAYGIGTLEGRGQLGGGVTWAPNLLWLILLLIGLGGAWYMVRWLELL